MSESILNALVRLFALISDIHEDTVISSREKNVVYSFLLSHLNNELAHKYMKMFEDYLGDFVSERITKDSREDRKRTTLNAMKILAICEEINLELRQVQKVYVIVQLIDYISLGAEISDNELDFLRTVASSFRINHNDYKNIEGFIMRGVSDVPEKMRVLVIDDSEEGNVPGTKHRYCQNMIGVLSFLHIHSADTFILRYSGSQDIYLNGLNISAGKTYIFDRGSSLRGPGIRTIYHTEVAGIITGTSNDLGITLEAINVTFRFRNSENGIQGLNFREDSGRLVGIMGGSGVGKSTTLSVLNGTLMPKGGRVLVNGFNLYDEEEKDSVKGVIGFVPQDDLLIEDLTVFQNLFYSARLCLNDLSEEKIREVVNKTLIDFDLEETRDLRVGNPLKKVISGGQRKRLNIALELLREPTILFVDEPTSGLSSVDSEMVMNLLKAQAYKGKLVIVNIHQPSSEIYKMFDKIMIIDKGGFQVFYGNPNEAIVYFKERTNHANPEEDQCVKCGNINTDQLLQIIEAKVIDEYGRPTRIRKVSPREWADKFSTYTGNKESEKGEGKKPLPENNFSIPGLLKQARIFFTRDMLSKFYNRQFLLISLLGPPFLAFLLAYFTRYQTEGSYIFGENENIPAYLFMCVITSFFFGLMLSSEEIVKDRRLLKRESFLNLSWLSYLNSKILMMFLFSAIQTISFVLIGNTILCIKGMTLSFWLVLFTTSCLANIMGLNISSAFNSVITIYILIPFIIIPQLLFSGVMVKFDKLHVGIPESQEYVPVIGDLMPARWSFEAIAVKQFRDNRYKKPLFENEINKSNAEWNSNLVDCLTDDLWQCGKNLNNESFAELTARNFEKLNFYIDSLARMTGYKPGSWKDSLNAGLFNKIINKRTSKYLDSVKRLIAFSKRTYDDNEGTINNSIRKSLGEEKFAVLQDNYENISLKNEVLNLNRKTRFVGEKNNRYIRKILPGYMVATSKFGRSHFYAPYKKLGRERIDTYVFNILALWFIMILLYLALYFKVLEKMIWRFGNLRFQKPEA